jgi:cytoplasmic tRNA 2-thiolation protein 2
VQLRPKPDIETLWKDIQLRYPYYDFVLIPFQQVQTEARSLSDLTGRASIPLSDFTNSEEPFGKALHQGAIETDRADYKSSVLDSLILKTASAAGCQGILWGHGSTRLAAQIFADTARGKAFSIPHKVGETLDPDSVNFQYPIGDIRANEIEEFAKNIDPPLTPLVLQEQLPQNVPTSKLSIDQLMQNYFASVESQFPNIVANVVQTSRKLDQPRPELSSECGICKMPFETAEKGPASPLCSSCRLTFDVA